MNPRMHWKQLRRAGAKRVVREAVRRITYELKTAVPLGRGRAARAGIRRAFGALEARAAWRERAISQVAIDAARLKRLAGSLVVTDAVHQRAFCDALLAAAEQAARKFRLTTLRSYVDVSVRMIAIRALAEHAATSPAFGGDACAVTSLLLTHAPDDRAVLLAHAELLLDNSRADEATPLLRRALRMQAVCPTAQQLLTRAVTGIDYDLRDKFCANPFTHLSTSYAGEAYACCCPAWLPYSLGNVFDAGTAEEVWNSESAVEIRRSIHDGDFRYCSRTLCSYIAAKKLPSKSEITDPVLRGYIDHRTVVLPDSPSMVQMNHDQSCNLACPSCRTGIITATPDEQRVYLDAADRVLLPLLRRVDGMAYISGGGEAFASAHYKKVLASLNRSEYPNLYVYLITNAQLLSAKRWAEFPHLPEMVGMMSVSIDAACAETYERLRRPAKWSVLMANLQLLAEMRAAGKIAALQINFVVQAENFRELPEFYALGNRLGVDSFWLQRLTSYGSFTETSFLQNDVTAPSHPDHAELLSILRQPFMRDPRMNMEMLMPLLPEIVESVVEVAWVRNRVRPEMAAVLRAQRLAEANAG